MLASARAALAMAAAIVALLAASPAARAERLLATRGWWGIQASYSVKWYDYRSNGRTHACNWFGESGVMQGIKFGLGVHPEMAHGFGVATGAFMEVFSCVNRQETKRIEDIAFYLPGHVSWQHSTSSWIQIHAETGPGFTWGVMQKIIDPKNSLHKGYHVAFDSGSPRRFNAWWDVSAGVTVKIFRFSVDFSLGLTPSTHYLSVLGQGTRYYKATPRKLAFSFGVVF